MKIGLAGSKGFIGTKLKKILYDEKYQFCEFDFDLRKKQNFKSADTVDIMVLLASVTPSVNVENNPDFFLQNNYNITINVLEYCRLNNVKLIFISTFLYGLNLNVPISENAKTSAETPYHLSKLICEKLCFFYHKKYHNNIIVLRPSNVYGNKNSDKNFVDHLLNRTNSDIKIFRPGDKRDFIHVSDLCQAIIKSIFKIKNINFDIFNIGSGKSYSKYDIIACLNLDQKYKYVNIDSKITDTQYNVLKAKSKLNWEPKIDLLKFLKNVE